MMMAITEEYKRGNASLCIYCGQVLAALKMPGGQLPWDTDVDSPMLAEDFYHVVDDIMPQMKKYGLVPFIKKGIHHEQLIHSHTCNIGSHTPNSDGILEGGVITIRHNTTDFTMDNYAKSSNFQCGHQREKGRVETKIKLDGIWLPGPDNPGKYGRTYGNEILRHVLHVKSSKTAYNDLKASFRG